VELRYENLFTGMETADLIRGLFGGWPDSSHQVPDAIGVPDYAGLRLHYCADADSDDCAIMIGIDSSPGKSTSSAFLEVSKDLDNESHEKSKLQDVTDQVHSILTTKFLSLTSDEMQQGWGIVDE
jgi:hypothetical protein